MTSWPVCWTLYRTILYAYLVRILVVCRNPEPVLSPDPLVLVSVEVVQHQHLLALFGSTVIVLLSSVFLGSWLLGSHSREMIVFLFRHEPSLAGIPGVLRSYKRSSMDAQLTELRGPWMSWSCGGVFIIMTGRNVTLFGSICAVLTCTS